MSGDGARLTDSLSGEAAQALIDIFHGVCLRVSWSLCASLIILASFLKGCGSLQSSAMASQKVPERFMQDMRPSLSTSQIATDSALLRPLEPPAIQRWICGRVER